MVNIFVDTPSIVFYISGNKEYVMQHVKPKDMFNLIEVAQDILGKLEPVNDYAMIRMGEMNSETLTHEEFIIIRDALIEANKMRIALQRIEKIHSESCSNQLARNALKLIKYEVQ